MVSWKLLLVSAAVMFVALGLKVSVPMAASHLPLLWSFFLMCLKPPYLFVILNAIIISIVVSSWFHHSDPTPHVESLPVTEPPLLEVKAVFVNGSSVIEEEEEEEDEKKVIEEEEEEEEEEKKVIEEEGMALKREDSTEILSSAEKPLLSARFNHRKFLKSSSEGGRALKVVAKAKRQETLESTWKAITEGRSMPLSRHIKKSDTWQHRVNPPPEETTFDDVSAAAGRLRKEPSLSQDELNRRVEAFIRKFNQDMRLQRQQSLEQYMQMINRGAA